MAELIIGGKFQLGKRIGKGSFGDVHLGTCLQTGRQVAIKLEALENEHALLPLEARLYRLFRGGSGFAGIHWYGVEGSSRAMVIDLLGPSLERLFSSCGRCFSLPTVLMIADQALSRLEYMHTRNFLHRDMKPDNFLIGRDEQAAVIYLIDFGLAKKYRDHGVHIPYSEGRSLTGTARYASVSAHLGIQQSRRDDLEALGYVLLYFLKGKLPWQGLASVDGVTRDELVKEKKVASSIDALCEDLPQEFAVFLNYCRSLVFDAKPDYTYLKRLLKDLRLRLGPTQQYDWALGTLGRTQCK